MASEKVQLKNQIAYLQSRRSGVEWAVDKPVEEVKAYIKRVGHDLEELGGKLYAIEKEEAELRESEKRRKAAAKLAARKA